MELLGPRGGGPTGPHVVQWIHKVTLPSGVTLDDAAALQLPAQQRCLLAMLDSTGQVHVVETCPPRDMVTWQQFVEDGAEALERAAGAAAGGSPPEGARREEGQAAK